VLTHDVLGPAQESAPAAPRAAVLLHGILGSKNNWKSFCRRAIDATPGLRCVVADLRGHGRSHGFAPPHTLAACASDVLALAVRPQVVIGHSFGGKVALELATRAPLGVESVVVLDAPPGVRSIGSGLEEVDRVIAAVRAVPMPIASRRDLVEHLRAQGLSDPIAQWMTTNLVSVEGTDALTWTFDLDVVGALLESFAAADYWPFLESHEGAPRVHLVRAGRGARFTAADDERLRRLAARGHVRVHEMPNAGHWLHTDDPEGLLAMLAPILRGEAAGAMA
jgi:esterase